MKSSVFIGLGSNMGKKRHNIKKAVDLINALPNVAVVKKSALYDSSPWGKVDQEDFINQVIEVRTSLGPWELLHKLQEIEINMGRQRLEKWGPRTIDLDILLYGDETIVSEELTIPHPLIGKRLFVLVPLQEINAELVFPDGTRIKEVLDRAVVRDRDNWVKRID
ncbi:MAG: 2-amino-4-hydroxy-6-hydroxymethyldihydropteridine diphosphokinase [Syntrophomonadaceae bacterium]